ncbi:MAG TPA: hypothetical protein VG917_02315 [Patescibacteria group bacterium]|nr:hypothetical protein [Patescibacteria group bacterium]
MHENKDNMESILTLHPQGKTGRKISKDKYNSIKKALLEVLKGKALTHNELFEALNKKLEGKFDGNINWYGETLKLDLEARKIIERTNDKPQKYKLT